MRSRIVLLPAVVVTAAAVVGGSVAGVAALRSSDDAPFRNSPAASATLDQIDPALVNPAAIDPGGIDGAPAGPSTPAALLPPAATREEAVQALLGALLAGDAGRSFSALAAADRATYGSPTAWEHELTARPRYLGYQPGTTDGDVVTTAVTIEPRLDEVAGFAPAAALVRWATVEEDGGFRVSMTDSVIEPVLPDDASAADAALRWVEAEQRCEPAATYDGNLLGQPVLADALCRSPGTFRAGAAEPIDRFRDPAVLLNAFGAEASTFVRIVPIDGPIPMQVAVAPLGAMWEVVGLMGT